MNAKILVVDDEPETRLVIRRCLEAAGHAVVETGDGASVPGLLLRERPDLVLLDVHMPGVDGISALGDVRDFAQTAAVVMVSGDDDPESIRLAMERGAFEYLVKPFSPADLAASVAAGLERRPGRRPAEGGRP